jgi:hypothetical protein
METGGKWTCVCVCVRVRVRVRVRVCVWGGGQGWLGGGGQERERERKSKDSRIGVCEGADGECVYAFMRSHRSHKCELDPKQPLPSRSLDTVDLLSGRRH